MSRPGSAALSLLLSAALALPVMAQEQATGVQFDDIPWEQGPVLGDLGSEAEVKVPGGCMFTKGDGVRMFMELTENTTSPAERAVVFCPDSVQQTSWFVVFTWDESGYVKDDERDKLDADALLTTLRKGTAADNEERAKHGYPALTLDGWAKPPFYDPETNNLTWGTLISTSEGGGSVNHAVRLLGRGGVMNVDLIVGRDEYEGAQPAFNAMAGGFTYKGGHRYSEWRSGDKLAAYGLTALVAGGAGVALANSGILAKLWKFIVAGVVAIAAGIKKFFGWKTEKAEKAANETKPA